MKFAFQILIIFVLVSVLLLNPFVIGLMYASIFFIGLSFRALGMVRYLIVGLMALVGTLFVHEIIGIFHAWLIFPFSCLLTFAVCKRNFFSFRKTGNCNNDSKNKAKESNRSSSDNHSWDDTQTLHKQKRLAAEASEDIIDVEVISEKVIHQE